MASRATAPAKPQGATAYRMSARLPKPEHCGINPAELIDQPRKRRYAVIELDVAAIIDDVDDDSQTAVIRINRIEMCDDKRAADLSSVLAQMAQQRTGASVLEFPDQPGGPFDE